MSKYGGGISNFPKKEIHCLLPKNRDKRKLKKACWVSGKPFSVFSALIILTM